MGWHHYLLTARGVMPDNPSVTAPPAEPTPFQLNVDARLRALGLSRLRLAKAAGLHPNTVYQWWKGGTPDTESLARIAPVLDIPHVELLRMAGRLEADGARPEAPSESLSSLQLDVMRRCDNMVDVVKALGDVPESEWLPHISRILDRTEDEIRDFTLILVRVHARSKASPERPKGLSARETRSQDRRMYRKRHITRKFRATSNLTSHYFCQDWPTGCSGKPLAFPYDNPRTRAAARPVICNKGRQAVGATMERRGP